MSLVPALSIVLFCNRATTTIFRDACCAGPGGSSVSCVCSAPENTVVAVESSQHWHREKVSLPFFV